WSELYAVTEERYRYIRAPKRELFDRARDRGETQNLAAQQSTTADAMDGWLNKNATLSEVGTPEEVPPEVREKLAALGSVGSGGTVAVSGELPDAKDKIASYEQLKAAIGLRELNKDAEAVAAFQALVKDNPTMLDAWEMLGFTLIRMGRTAEGIAAVDRALKL